MSEALPPDLVDRYLELAKAKQIKAYAAHTIVERLCEEVFRLYRVRAKDVAIRKWHEHCVGVAEEVLEEHELYGEYEARLDPDRGPPDDYPSPETARLINAEGRTGSDDY